MILWCNQGTYNAVYNLIKSAELVPRKARARRRTNKHDAWSDRDKLNIVTAFDIETTTIKTEPTPGKKHCEHGFMYVWQWRFSNQFTVMGRTWDEFTAVCNAIQSAISQRNDNAVLLSFIHNLSFQFQYFTGIYDFTPEQVFAVKPRRILYCRMYGCIQYRCSYLQSNMSLQKFAQAMQTKTRKASGADFDYTKQRFPWTELTQQQLDYCERDVISVVQAITNQMQKQGDTLLTIPLTATGYVRRQCKTAIARLRKSYIQPQLPGVQLYKLLRQAFRGGNCHCNPYYQGKTVSGVVSYDMVSCYPAQQLTQQFPVTPFEKMDNPDMKKVIQAIRRDNKAVIARYTFHGIKLKSNKTPIPYISLSKCRAVGKTTYKRNRETGRKQVVYRPVRCDNGRVLYAQVCKMTLTEIDLEIILNQYKYHDVSVSDVWTAGKGMLPAEYRRVIKRYYERKTKLKTAQKTDENARYWYGKNKNLLNGVYGMSSQDPVHEKVQYIGRGYQEPYRISDYDDGGASQRLQCAAFPYQWGCWTTALARRALQQSFMYTWRDKNNHNKGSRLIYSDTDSIKVQGRVNLSQINRKRIDLALRYGAYATDDAGEVHYMGVYQVDGEYQYFKSLGAKRYCDIENGKLSITVSGVTKKRDPDTGQYIAAQELGTMDNFKQGFTFEKSGGTSSLYNDDDDFYWTDPESGREVHITNNVCILDSTYQLSNDGQYLDLLQQITTYGSWKKERQ